MSAWTEAEEADAWAAEQARVAEWASQHKHPVTVALRQRDRALAALGATATCTPTRTLTPDDLHLIRKRADESTAVLAVADRRHLLAELDRLHTTAAETTRERPGAMAGER